MSTTDPSRKRHYSLRRRLLFRTFGALLVVFLLTGVGVASYARRAADYSYDRLLEGSSLSILRRVYALGDKVQVNLPYTALNMLGQAPEDRVFYQVLGPEGQHLTGYRNLPLPEDFVPSSRPFFFNARYSGEKVRFVVQSRLLVENGVDGWVTVEVGQTCIARHAMAHRVLFAALGLLAVVMLLGLLFVAVGINQALAPLKRITGELRRRTPTDFQPLHTQAPREIMPLVETLNFYIGRLHNNLNAMQVFIADAANQIRTPMATLQAHLEMADHSRDPEEWQARIGKARDQNRHLIRLTNQLLAHAMVIHRGDTQRLEPVNLRALLEQLLVDTVRDHAHTPLEFAFYDRTGNAWISGDAFSLKEAFRNVLDNAIKYGPENNLITLELRGSPTAEDRIEVRIEDRGPGIEPESRQRSLKRFERLQPDREGSGLGLAIVQAVVVNHGATLTLEQAPGGGLAVVLSFPEHPDANPL